MSAEDNIRIVRDYLAGRGPELMAEDATLYDWADGEPIQGREAIEAMFTHYYEEAFSEASAEYRNWVANDECVVLEFTFCGVNTANTLTKRFGNAASDRIDASGWRQPPKSARKKTGDVT